MKLIIELDDDIAKGIRGENECEVEPREIVRSFQATIADAIANGTPYNPSGDLISRSDLIKAFNEAQVEFDEYYKGLGKAKVITDNAQTISDRPIGKWIDKGHGRYGCSVCGHFPATQSGFPWLSSFCPECGADMR